MPKFREKPPVVEAEQWFPGKTVPGVYVPTTGTDTPFVLSADNQVIPVAAGDWILPDGAGHKPVNPVVFEEMYEEIDE